MVMMMYGYMTHRDARHTVRQHRRAGLGRHRAADAGSRGAAGGQGNSTRAKMGQGALQALEPQFERTEATMDALEAAGAAVVLDGEATSKHGATGDIDSAGDVAKDPKGGVMKQQPAKAVGVQDDKLESDTLKTPTVSDSCAGLGFLGDEGSVAIMGNGPISSQQRSAVQVCALTLRRIGMQLPACVHVLGTTACLCACM